MPCIAAGGHSNFITDCAGVEEASIKEDSSSRSLRNFSRLKRQTYHDVAASTTVQHIKGKPAILSRVVNEKKARNGPQGTLEIGAKDHDGR